MPATLGTAVSNYDGFAATTNTVTYTPAAGETTAIMFSVRNSGTTSGVTVDGNAATQIGSNYPKGYFGQTFSVWQITGITTGSSIDAIATGSNSSGGQFVVVPVLTANQTNAVAAFSPSTGSTGASSTPTTPTLTVTAGELLLGFLTSASADNSTTDTEVFSADSTAQTGNGDNSAISAATAATTSENLSWTTTSGAAWGTAIIQIAPASGGGAAIADPGDLSGGRGYNTSWSLTSTGWTAETWSVDSLPAGITLTDNADGTATVTHDGTSTADEYTPTFTLGSSSRQVSITIAAEPSAIRTTDASGIASISIDEGPSETSGDRITIEVTQLGVTKSITRTKA